MIFDEAKYLCDLLEKYTEKHKDKKDEEDLNKLLIYIFKDENNLIGKKKLKENTDLSLKTIFKIIKKAEKKGFIKGCNTDWGWSNKEQRKWKLKKDGEFYVEALLEELINHS